MAKQNKITTFFKEIGYFLSSKYFLKNFGYILAAIILLMLILFWWILPSYTRHNEEIKVTDICNLTIEQAQKMVKSLGLRLVITDSTYNPSKNPGIIVEQTPKKDSRVKPNRAIYVTVNATQAPLVNLFYNQVISVPLDQVERKFASLDIKIGKLNYVSGRGENTVRAAFLNGKILFKEADPSKGERKPTDAQPIPRGAVVDLEVYKGEGAEMKAIPNLICGTYEEATFKITGNEYYIGNITLDPSVGRDTGRAVIVRQSPRPGSRAGMGTSIDIWLDMERPKECDD